MSTQGGWSRSCRAALEFGLGLALYRFFLPGGDVIKIVWPHFAARENIGLAHEVGAGDLRSDRALDGADEGLRNTKLLSQPLLGLSFPTSPLSELHRDPHPNGVNCYCGQLYFVNGHNQKGATEYNAVAYVLPMHPGTRIRELRKVAHKTQGELGDDIGMSQEAVSQMENDKRPTTVDTLRAIARALDCSVADLLTDSDHPERLTDEERELLRAFRDSAAPARDYLLTSAQAVADLRRGYRAAG